MVNITKYKKIYYSISGILIVASLFTLAIWGLNFGIDFTGGSLMEVEFSKIRPSNEKILENLGDFQIGDVVVQPLGESEVILRFRDVSEEQHQLILAKIVETAEQAGEGNAAREKSFESVGPTIGRELKTKSLYAIILVLATIVAYVAFAFRKVSFPLSSWKYGIITLAALFHDVIIPMGVFAVLGRFYNVEINTAFIAAILTVLGYSVNDTIVIFDRVRENLLKRSSKDFEETINISLNQTFVRSLNTSLTTLFVLFAIYLFGGESLKNFSLVLLIGIAAGTYSSLFLAAPMLVSWKERMYGKK